MFYFIFIHAVNTTSKLASSVQRFETHALHFVGDGCFMILHFFFIVFCKITPEIKVAAVTGGGVSWLTNEIQPRLTQTHFASWSIWPVPHSTCILNNCSTFPVCERLIFERIFMKFIQHFYIAKLMWKLKTSKLHYFIRHLREIEAICMRNWASQTKERKKNTLSSTQLWSGFVVDLLFIKTYFLFGSSNFVCINAISNNYWIWRKENSLILTLFCMRNNEDALHFLFVHVS